jgi:DNA integrity scanning protein DisA with diadenylate cyclase activity
MQVTVGLVVSYHREGWRVGTIKQLDPGKGLRKGMVQITHPVTGDLWVPVYDVNELGDTTYHGPKALDVFEERTELKKEQQAKADKLKEKARRFHR